MKYLFIDTATSNLIISIIKDMEMIYCFNEEVKESSSKIMAVVDEAFNKTNIKPTDIDKIFVVNGPGSFTGIRVGLTLAKVMAWSLNIPLIPLSKLELLATISNSNKIMPMIDARRGYVYGGVYDNNLNVIYNDTHILKEELLNKATDYEIITEGLVDIIKIIKKHENDKPVNPHTLKPNYLKLTEAEEKLNDKVSN